MKKILVICLIMIGFIGIRLDVSAAASVAVDGDENFSSMKTSYENGITKVSISSPQWVTIYGKSSCNGTSCTLSYAGNNSNFETVLQKSVTCTNGEKYIHYQSGSSGKTTYAEDNKAKYNGTAYWSEEYYITCTSDTTGEQIIQTENTVEGNTGGTTGGETTGGTSDNTTNNGGYGSATTEDNPQTGVNTYFIVLGIVAVISYAFMTIVKKYNLFKKI